MLLPCARKPVTAKTTLIGGDLLVGPDIEIELFLLNPKPNQAIQSPATST